jgi:hypothetical protein
LSLLKLRGWAVHREAPRRSATLRAAKRRDIKGRGVRTRYTIEMSTPAAIPAAGKMIQLRATKKKGLAEKNLVL